MIARSLYWKLTIAFLLVALTVALLVALSIRLTTAGQLGRLIVEQQRSELEARLVNYYQTNGSWRGIQAYYLETRGTFATQQPGDHGPGFGGSRGGGQGPPSDRRDLFGLANAQGRVVIPLLPTYPLGMRVSPAVLAQGEPVEVEGEVVGTILTAGSSPGLTLEETAFLRRTNLALLLAGGGAVLVALLVGAVLARTLTQPLRALTQATQRMAGGALAQEVPVQSADEIGDLALAFNQMSKELTRATRARRQMSADIAHELRTPLTVIAGYIESMRDGVLAPTPQRLEVIYAEIEQLQHLVGDLRMLSQAEAGELKLSRQPVAVRELLGQAQAAFSLQAQQKGVALAVTVDDSAGDASDAEIHVDENRMAQVLGNLLSNAIRHTPAGGRVTLGAESRPDCVRLFVQDTGQGIAPQDLPFIFNRFYRADKARGGDGAESGLGLAIAQALVEAHGGRLTVASQVGKGARFEVVLGE